MTLKSPGTNDFVEEIIKVVEKVEEDKFRYTGLDVNVISDGIEISMKEYAKSMQNLTVWSNEVHI